jgi:hypothetical protein
VVACDVRGLPENIDTPVSGIKVQPKSESLERRISTVIEDHVKHGYLVNEDEIRWIGSSSRIRSRAGELKPMHGGVRRVYVLMH